MGLALELLVLEFLVLEFLGGLPRAGLPHAGFPLGSFGLDVLMLEFLLGGFELDFLVLAFPGPRAGLPLGELLVLGRFLGASSWTFSCWSSAGFVLVFLVLEFLGLRAGDLRAEPWAGVPRWAPGQLRAGVPGDLALGFCLIGWCLFANCLWGPLRGRLRHSARGFVFDSVLAVCLYAYLCPCSLKSPSLAGSARQALLVAPVCAGLEQSSCTHYLLCPM